MTTASKQIVEAAMKLPEDERAAIIEELYGSLSPALLDEIDLAWSAELDRRRAEFDRTGEGTPWEELKTME